MPGLTMRLKFAYCEPCLVETAFVPGEVAILPPAVASREDSKLEPEAVGEPDFLTDLPQGGNELTW